MFQICLSLTVCSELARKAKMSGKDFYRAMHAVKLVDIVLNSRLLLQVRRWCEQKLLSIQSKVCDILPDRNNFFLLNRSIENPWQYAQPDTKMFNIQIVGWLNPFSNSIKQFFWCQHNSTTKKFKIFTWKLLVITWLFGNNMYRIPLKLVPSWGRTIISTLTTDKG